MRRLFSFVFLLLAPAVALAGNTSSTTPYRLAMSDSVTSKVVSKLEGGSSECRSVPAIYQVDCYRQSFRRAGSEISRYPDYSEARKALRQVEAVLKAALRQYGDKSNPALRKNGRAYKPIRPEGVKPANAAFERARREAATVLLRAKGPIKVHYERIAAVVGSSKLIIRSGLLKQFRLI